MWHEVTSVVNLIRTQLKYPDKVVLESATGPEVTVLSKKILMFGSYNYLGLANNPKIKKRTMQILGKYGVGSGGVRLLTGTMDIHELLEKKVAQITSQEDALTIASGYGTNAGIIPGLVNLFGLGHEIHARDAIIFCDEYNHASIIDGCKLSNALLVKYSHCDMKDLENKVAQYPNHRKLIITDGIFSMDGDVAPIDKIILIARQHGAMTMVDDAHAFGVIGENGSGTASYFGRDGEVDVNMGTFSKGIGVSGGFVSGKKDLIDLLRASCKSYMFSDSLSPMVVGAVIAALDYIVDHQNLGARTQALGEYFRAKVKVAGFNTLQSTTQIIPIVTGSSELTVRYSRELMSEGVCVPAIRWPAVPRNLGRLRFAISADHTKRQIDRVVKKLLMVRKKIEIA